MERRDIVIGIVILAALAGFIYFRSQREVPEELQVRQTLSVEDQLEFAFDFDIPDDVEKAELKDVSGGNATGIATRKFDAGRFTHAVLADLPDPEPGTFYEGWLVMDDSLISTGRLRIAKGGYLLEFQSSTDYSSYDNAVVTLERVADSVPEEHILEGSF